MYLLQRWLLQEIAKETETGLGERAYCFVDLYNDWLDLRGCILDTYPKDLPYTSLFAADFFGLGKDLHWMHRLLHWSNYPLIHRLLRYDWELMFRAYYADVYTPSIPGDSDVPGDSVDDKVNWLESREQDLHFGRLIAPISNVILATADERRQVRQLWRNLNQHIHPTKELRIRMIDDSASVVRDSFDETWADETLVSACAVFDLIWLITLNHFPHCLPS